MPVRLCAKDLRKERERALSLRTPKTLNLHIQYARAEKEATTGQQYRTRAGERFRLLFRKRDLYFWARLTFAS